MNYLKKNFCSIDYLKPEFLLIFKIANKRFEAALQIKPDDSFALYNWAFALRKQAQLSSGQKARE